MEITGWLKTIYQNSGDTGLHIPSIHAFADAYQEAVAKGYGTDFDSIDYDHKDYKILANLRNNIYNFSAAKNHQELKLLTEAILDDKGKVRSFKTWSEEAAKIVKLSRVDWMRAEYNFAVAGSQMASKWNEYEPDDLLRYEAVKDSRTREEHRKLDGVTKPASDVFWKTYYPPNGWNCRCDVDRVAYGSITPDENIELPEVVAMMAVNLGMEGIVFPDGHPYYKGFKLVDYLLKKPVSEQYIRKDQYQVHSLAHYMPKYRDKNQWADIVSTAGEIGKIKGTEVQILPEIQHSPGHVQLRNKVLKGAKGRSNPDYRINGHYADLKVAEKSFDPKSFIKRIKKAKKQTDFPVIKLADNPDRDTVARLAERRFKGERLKGMIIYNSKNEIVFKRLPKK